MAHATTSGNIHIPRAQAIQAPSAVATVIIPMLHRVSLIPNPPNPTTCANWKEFEISATLIQAR
jgi:hypothetical protein